MKHRLPFFILLTLAACAAPRGPDPALARIDERLAAIESRLAALEAPRPEPLRIPTIIMLPADGATLPGVVIPSVFPPPAPPPTPILIDPSSREVPGRGGCALPRPGEPDPAK